MIFAQRFLLLLMLLGLSSLKAQQFTTHDIIMLLDTSEYKSYPQPIAQLMGALSINLIQALGAKVAPIITTSLLLNRVFTHKEDIFRSTKITQEDLDAWIYRKINDLYYLLIPKDYISGLEAQMSKIPLKDNKATALELTLGLKIDHLEMVMQKDAVLVPEVIAIESIVDRLQDIFVMNSEYAQKPNIEKPRWAMYLMGHGFPKTDNKELQVAGLPLNYFKKILEFLNAKISVGFLFFNTCYSGGANLQAIYQDANKASVQKTFNFPIASVALSEAPSYMTMSADSPLPFHFRTFFKGLKQDGPIDFVDTLNSVTDFLKNSKIINVSNIPLFKLPGLEWVSVIDIPNKIVSIGKTLARSRNADQPLNISRFFARGKVKQIYPEAVLLYTDIIPFPLQLSQQNNNMLSPAWISMIGGNAVHEFAQINAHEFGVSDVIASFFTIEELKPQKIFLIRELNVKNDGLMEKQEKNASLTLYNVVLVTNALPSETYVNWIYFTTPSNVFYKGTASYKPLSVNVWEIKENYIDEWLKKAAAIKTEIQRQPQSVFAENLDELKKVMKKGQIQEGLKDLIVQLKELQDALGLLNKNLELIK